MKVAFRKSAAQQVRHAQAWYESQQPGLGLEFMRSVDAAMARVARNPYAAPEVYPSVRRVLTKRFPYALFYLPQAGQLVVLSCIHTRQNVSV